MTKINWNKELVNHINDELAKGKNFPQIAKQLRRETGIKYNKDDVRLGYQRHTDWIEEGEAVKPLLYKQAKKASDAMAKAFSSNTAESVDTKQPIEFKKLANGDYSSSRTLNLSDEELKDEATLLRLHGYDPNSFEIRTASNSRNERETNKGTKHSYNSRITVKPKTELSTADIMQEMYKHVEPIHIETHSLFHPSDTLVVPLYDLHFGIASTESMKESLTNLISIVSRGYHEIVIISGGDIIHSDKITKSETAKGTQLDAVNMRQAIKDARQFYDVLFRTALQSTKNVKHYSITGNHDRDSGYLLNLLLEAQYPQIEHHVGDYRQAFKVGTDTGIMIMHGDLATKNAPLLFAQEYREIWNNTKHHQIISGHFHYDKTTEIMGVELIQVGTNKPNDPYETANGYVGNNKQLTAIIYNKSRMIQRNYL
ncbi:hypothetical protein [Leuconostoc falkenbergense]|uniref:hypothetical protein n=1 Tax=Leuconostoc falkenbergense TaxID=2766470 RepID=UPI001667AD5B|nr:hypothetical protein [Leuconostoc falkenbergense]